MTTILSDTAPCQRGEDAAEAQNGKDGEDHVHAADKCRVIFGRYLNVADINAENKHNQPHAEGHSDLPHGSQGCRRHTVASPVYGAHNRVGIG